MRVVARTECLMQKLSVKVVVVAMLACWVHVVVAADDEWKVPNLNPFASKGKPPTTGHISDAPTSGWHMPKLWTKSAAPKRKTNQPSTWSKMTGGTQKFFTKTADALTPWDNKKPAAPPPKITGSNSIFSQSQAAKKQSQSSSVQPASWWSTESKD